MADEARARDPGQQSRRDNPHASLVCPSMGHATAGLTEGASSIGSSVAIRATALSIVSVR